MNLFQQKLNDILYHLENGNDNLGFRMLVDVVLDTANLANFQLCIALAEWQEFHPTELELFNKKAISIVKELNKQDYVFEQKNSILVMANDITKQYGKSTFVLGPISLDIKSGQLIGLVGENGNGKTTLLRMLAKELSTSAGEIVFPFSPSLQDDYTLRTKLTYIPQRTPKWFGKVKDNLKLTATHYGILPEENESWVLMLMIRFGLWKFRNYSWNELSSGYKMRFELARTFLRKPQLLLLDEPLANLDILSQQLILEDLKMLGKSLRNPLGIVLSSQQLYEVEKVSDEVIFLKNGKASSFNNLKDAQQTTTNRIIVELEIANTKEELQQALASFSVAEINLLGSNYYLEIDHCTTKELLLQLVQNNIQLNYFRDISFSTRRFFNQQ